MIHPCYSIEKGGDFMQQSKSYEPSRHVCDFHIKGFNRYEGLDVINELQLGTEVNLVIEPDNPYDPSAVAIYFKNKKIGYIPEEINSLISKFLYFGHHHLFEAKIQYASKEAHFDRQFRVVVRLKDNR